MPRDTTLAEGQKIILHDNWKRVIIRYHPAKYGAYRYCGSGDIKFLWCHVIPRDQKTKKLYDMTIGNMSSLGIILPSLVFIGVVEVEI